jgi:hypothetical protein
MEREWAARGAPRIKQSGVSGGRDEDARAKVAGEAGSGGEG